MIDAATIGITLALQDGVSAGIATIARDLAALDRATDGAATNLTRLATMAETMRAGPLARLTDAASRAATIALPQPGPSPAATAPPEESVTTTSDRAANAPASAHPAATAAAPRAADAPGATHSAPIAPAEASPYAAFAPTAAQPTFAPVTSPAHSFAPADTQADTGPPRIAAAPVTATSIAPGARADPGPAIPRAAAAPRAVTGFSTPPTAAPDAPAPSIPPSSTGPDTQSEGRLVLEGFELGRWMSDRLNREATRPPAGATGFDPRLSPAWPGPASGY